MKVLALGFLFLAVVAPSAATPTHPLLTYSQLIRNRTTAEICVGVGRQARRLTPVAGWESAWSRDGRRLTFSAKGLGLRNLTHGFAVFSYGATWSPDGKRLAFSHAWHGGGIAVMRRDGSGRRLVPGTGTGSNGSVSAPTWSPSGSEIARVIVHGAADPAWSRN